MFGNFLLTYNNIKLDVLIHNAKRDAAKTSLYVLTFQNYFLLEITTAAAAIAMGRTARTIPVSAGVVSAAGAGVLSTLIGPERLHRAGGFGEGPPLLQPGGGRSIS